MRPLNLFRCVVFLLTACGGERTPEVDLAQSRQALCSCSFELEYRVPVVAKLCRPNKDGVVVCAPVDTAHTVVCQNQCFACGTMTCSDLTAGTTTTRPAEEYLVDEQWFPCNSRNVCS